jgi:hypothetical protein
MVGYKKPPSIEKSQKVTAAFEAKVVILEGWARNGLPEDILRRATQDGTLNENDLPRDHAKLRRWQGPDGNLATWSDPLIDRPVTGKHPDLAERFRFAISNIEKWLAQKKGQLSALKIEVEVLKAVNNRLLIQNADLLSRIQQLQSELAVSKAREITPRR